MATRTLSRPDPRSEVLALRCGYCERSVDPETATRYADGLVVCGPCIARERDRYAAQTGGDCTRCPYNLAWHVEGRCPTEDEARRWSGTA